MNEIIFAYTRRDALADGQLIDVSAAAKEAGIMFPVAVTAAVWHGSVTVPRACPEQEEARRLWDIVWMLRYAITSMAHPDSMLLFVVLIQNDEQGPKEVTFKAVCGPGDAGEPVITIMLPTED